VSTLRNLGSKSERWLNEIGVCSKEDLEKPGSIEAYRLLKQKGYPVSLNLVWAIEGALTDTDWRDLPSDLKAELKAIIQRI
jgi:DNA transformation protein and related proteins